MNPTNLSFTEAARQLATRNLSPVELTQAYLDRIAQHNPALNAFITPTPELALEQARRAETELLRGYHRGPLHGLPVALKDLYDLAGIPTTGGAAFRRDHIPTADSMVVQKLRESGAILVGKLNMHEIALGVISNNPHYGTCYNPWGENRIPGGSSGGSAAALAAGLCLGAMGSDTRGSIRIPAALCGIVGLKPTYGRVSLRGVMPLSWSLDHAGPMARTVTEVAHLLNAIAGDDPLDPSSDPHPVDDYTAGLDAGIRGWKIAVARDAYFTQADADVLSAFEAAVALFAGLGAEIVEVDLAAALDTRQTSRVIVSSDAAAYHRERLTTSPEDFGADVRARLLEGLNFPATDYALARRAQAVARQRLTALFTEYDLLLTPTVPLAAPRLDDAAGLDRARASLSYFTAPFNMSGNPAISVPCGFNPDGLPLGVQIIAGHWQEAHLLRGAYAYEQAAGWYRQRPPGFAD